MIRLRRLTPTICAFHLGFSLVVRNLCNDDYGTVSKSRWDDPPSVGALSNCGGTSGSGRAFNASSRSASTLFRISS